jgi:hypothetical protein
MKALYQEWTSTTRIVGRRFYTISKDMEQYSATVTRLQAAKEDGARPDSSDPIEVEVSDESEFPEELEKGTVFLSANDLKHITFESR